MINKVIYRKVGRIRILDCVPAPRNSHYVVLTAFTECAAAKALTLTTRRPQLAVIFIFHRTLSLAGDATHSRLPH